MIVSAWHLVVSLSSDQWTYLSRIGYKRLLNALQVKCEKKDTATLRLVNEQQVCSLTGTNIQSELLCARDRERLYRMASCSAGQCLCSGWKARGQTIFRPHYSTHLVDLIWFFLEVNRSLIDKQVSSQTLCACFQGKSVVRRQFFSGRF